MILYRGFNNNYSKALGVRPEQKGIWMTEDEEYAKEYADMFKNGAIAEIELNDNANIANNFDCERVFRDNEDFGYGEDIGEYLADLGGDIEFDNQVCDTLSANGYDGVMFDDYDKECYYIFNRKIIKGYKIIKTFKNNREDAMESINNILKNAGVKQLNESWSDVDDFLDIQEETRPYDVLMMYQNGEKNIWYPLIKPSEYKQALKEFMKYGEIVRYPEDKIYNWLKIIFKNTCLIESITQLAGHTEWFPYEEVKDAYSETENLPETWKDFSSFLEEQGFYDWCKLPDGSDAWSDYGLKPLYNILNEYNDSMNAGQVLVLINRCLDVYHQRGDLASAFIDVCPFVINGI